MKKSIRGHVTIKISDDQMKAYLDYEPSEVLTEWSDEIILKLLDNAGVKKGFKKYQFSRILAKIENNEVESSFDIATGVYPISTSISKFNIISKPIPESLIPIYKRLVENTPPSVVYPIIEDYFLDEEPEETKFVILKYFYVNKEDIVVTIDKNAKPKNGYTVTGKELVPSKEEENLKFLISKNFKIDAEKGIIKPKESGFLLLGKNGLDLIPFKGHKFSIQPSEDYAEYYLIFSPGSEEAPKPIFNDILGLFEDIDYPLELLKSEEIILQSLSTSITEKKPIKISLTKKKKAIVKIDINQTKTKATLILEKGAGPGSQLSLKVIGELIRESKIKGMNLESLKKRILSFYKSKELSLEFVILEGRTATRGDARKLKYQKEFLLVDKIEDLINRINDEIEAFYPSFKIFKKEDISSGMLVKKGFEFAILTDAIPGDDGTDIYGNKIKGLIGNDPIIKTFENISVKQNKYISEIDGILDLGDVNGETYLRVREHKDMFVDVSISVDAMNASFTFYKEEGSGEVASLEFIKRQIEASGVCKGIDESIIEQSFEKFVKGELISEVVFAMGRIPSDKKSSRIKYFNNQGRTKFSFEVEAGTKIAQIFPSKSNTEDGFDVLGTVMESSGVISLDLKIGDYIIEENLDDGSILLIAEINGELKVDENSLSIIDKKVLASDVSVKTGSIKTLCSIVIKGSVLSSLYVVSGGNIKIMGTVQGALISADKNIIIVQGVKGEDKAVLRAKEKIDVKFIEKAYMMAIDDIHIRKAAMHTKMISNGKILFDKNGTKVVGGETYAKKGLTVDEIGSPSGGVTRVSFGQDYLVADKIKVFEGDVDKIQQDLLKIEQILHNKSDNIGSDKITHLRKQKVFLMKKLEKKNMKLFLLREKFEEHASSEIIVRSKIYPGVVFESHGRKLEIMEPQSMCKIVFNSNTGQIEKT